MTVATYQWEDYYAKLPGAVSSGNGPDIAVMHMDQLATHAARQIIQPLDDVATALELTEADFAPTVWKGGMYQDKRYGIPLDMHPLGFYYNKAAPAAGRPRPGEAADQPAGVRGRAGRDEEPRASRASGSARSSSPAAWRVYSVLYQFGGVAVQRGRHQGDVQLARGRGGRHLDDRHGRRHGYSPKNVGQDADYLAFKGDKNAFNWNGIWQINDLKKSPEP